MDWKREKIRRVIILLFLLFLLSDSLLADGKFLRGEKWQKLVVDSTKANFYVAVNGNDTWSGTLSAPNEQRNDGPFASIERAQQAVVRLKSQLYKDKKKVEEARYIGSSYRFGEGKDILVLIRGGFYYLKEPFRLNAEHGGERCETDLPSGAFEFHKLKDYFVTFAAYPGEKPVFCGGIKLTSWRQHKNVWTTQVNEIEVQKLIVNGVEQRLARMPNDGYFTPATKPQKTTEFVFRENDLQNWPDLDNNRIHFLLRWHTGVNSIIKIDDINNIAYLKETQPGMVEVPPRYFIDNMKSLLDVPGEWFFDSEEKTVSFIPEENMSDPNRAHIMTPVVTHLLIIKGSSEKPVRNLRFYGLTFEATKAGGDAISFEYAKNCELVDSELRNVGGIGILVTTGCYQNRILNNKIFNADNGGIAVRGNPHPEKWLDVVRENLISFNFVSDCGGMSIGAHNTLYTTISNNEITRSRGRYAMNVGGWSNVEEALEGGYRIEYNHLFQVQNGADDSGAITCSGLTHDSIIRNNVIHDVFAGFFNDNVAFWFDNMSSGWRVENNIYYNLQQGEMKLCACYLEDNIYQNNFVIEAPANQLQGIIEGLPAFEYSEVKIFNRAQAEANTFSTGEFLSVSAQVLNKGASGMEEVALYVNRKIVDRKLFPVIQDNKRTITFDWQFAEPGDYTVAVGSAPWVMVKITGEKQPALYSDLVLSNNIAPVGKEIIASLEVRNATESNIRTETKLFIDDEFCQAEPCLLPPKATKRLAFLIKPEIGMHAIRVNNEPSRQLIVYPFHKRQINSSDWDSYCSGTAQPCDFFVAESRARFQINVRGTDFYHAEDSYGAIYLKEKVKGNFTATVKVVKFGESVTEWFRTGLFVRNDITKSFETEEGSLGSVLMFTTPKRYGMQWDEFGDGCMHKASSRNYDQKISQVWIRLERHGNCFSGLVSFDGKNWAKYGETTILPGLADAVQVALAAGANNQASSLVEFEDFQLEVEDEGWKDK